MERNKYFNRLGIMLDCSRNAVMKPKKVFEWIDIISDLGFNTLMLYTEDTFEVENQPYFGRFRGRYSSEELKEIEDYANSHNMEVIMCIQTLAHLKRLFHWPHYREIQDCNDIILAGDERTYTLIDDIFRSLAKNMKSRVVNIGLDEAFLLGSGKYQRINGYESRASILLKHLKRVAEIAEKYGFELIMWGDMFFRVVNMDEGNFDMTSYIKEIEKIRKDVPKNVNLVYWDYYLDNKAEYTKKMRAYSAIKGNIWFAGGLWTWAGIAPHNKFTMKVTPVAIDACIENQIKDVFFTMWRDDGGETSVFSLLPALYYTSEKAKGNMDDASIKEGFKEKFGIDFDDFMLVDLPDTANTDSENIVDPDKYLFYNDCFLGSFDSTIRPDDSKRYAECAKKLEKIENSPKYGYLFSTMRRLCEFLALKIDIGVRARTAYQSGDRKELEAVEADFKELAVRLEEFYKVFLIQWDIENKPHGYEVQDIRIGGMLKRFEHCAARIKAYLSGELERIEELEEPILDYKGNGTDLQKGPIRENGWDWLASANTICF